jgi:predicted nucleic acid-binding protein
MLVDTSVWIDHFRRRNAALASLLARGRVLRHPFVVGELAGGALARRAEILSLMAALPAAVVAEHDEVLALVASHGLAGSGIGWIDAHLLAAALLSSASLWTLDRRLARAALRIGVLATPQVVAST